MGGVREDAEAGPTPTHTHTPQPTPAPSPQRAPAAAPAPAAATPVVPGRGWAAARKIASASAFARRASVTVHENKIVVREPSGRGGAAFALASPSPAATEPLAGAAADDDAAARAAAAAGGAFDADEVVREIHFSGGSARLLARHASRGHLVGAAAE